MFKINEVSTFTGLTIRTLHYYDEIGLVSPKRAPNGHRCYSYADLIRLYEVKLLKQTGLSLIDIQKNIELSSTSHVKESFARQKQFLQNKLQDIQNQIDKLEELKMSYNSENSFDDRIIKEIFIENNPLKTETNEIWDIRQQKEVMTYQFKIFDKPLKFDDYYVEISKLHKHPINSLPVQHEIKKYIIFLIDYYNNTLNKSGLIVMANAYKNNNFATEYLKKYGENFPVFLCDGMLYYLNHNDLSNSSKFNKKLGDH